MYSRVREAVERWAAATVRLRRTKSPVRPFAHPASFEGHDLALLRNPSRKEVRTDTGAWRPCRAEVVLGRCDRDWKTYQMTRYPYKEGTMRKIIFLGMAIALTATMLGLGVQAQFCDTETVKSKAIAGSLNLTVDGKDGVPIEVCFGDCLAPNKCCLPDACHTFKIKNTGCVDGYVNIKDICVTNLENGCLEPEIEWGDDPTSSVGELGDRLRVRLLYMENALLGKQIYEGPVNGLPSSIKLNDLLLRGGCDVDLIVECIDWPDGTCAEDSVCMSDSVEIQMVLSLSQYKI